MCVVSAKCLVTCSGPIWTIQRVVGASGGITYGRVARETEIQLVGVLDRPG